jgi:hypothetical protein
MNKTNQLQPVQVTLNRGDLRDQIQSLQRMLAHADFQSLEWKKAYDGYLHNCLSIADVEKRTKKALEMVEQAGFQRVSITRGPYCRLPSMSSYMVELANGYPEKDLDAIDCYLGHVWHGTASVDDIMSYFYQNQGRPECNYLLTHVVDIMAFLADVSITWKSMTEFATGGTIVREMVLSNPGGVSLLQSLGHIPKKINLHDLTDVLDQPFVWLVLARQPSVARTNKRLRGTAKSRILLIIEGEEE